MLAARIYHHRVLNVEVPRDAIEEDLRRVAAYLIRTYRCHEAERAVLAYHDPNPRHELAWNYVVHAFTSVGLSLGEVDDAEVAAALRRLAVVLHPDLEPGRVARA
jgi:hypothetical protein